MCSTTLSLVNENAWIPSVMNDFDSMTDDDEIIEYFGSVTKINEASGINMKIDTITLENHTIFLHSGKPIDNDDVCRLIKAGDMRGNKGVSSKGYATKILLAKFNNNDTNFDNTDIFNSSFFISKITEPIKIKKLIEKQDETETETYTEVDKYIMFRYILNKVDGQSKIDLHISTYIEFPDVIKMYLTNDPEKNISIFVRKKYSYTNELREKLRFIFSMTDWSLYYDNMEILEENKPGKFIDKCYEGPYLDITFTLYTHNGNAKIGKIDINDSLYLTNEIENSYYIKIDGGAKNDTLKKQTFSEFILHNIKKSDSLTRQYSCNLILQNIMNNSADIRDHFYGQDIREAGFVLNKNGMMYQTKVPSQKRNNIHRPYLIGIRPDGRHIKEGGPFLKGQNLQCVVCDEIDYNQTIEPTYKSISMFDVQKVKADTDIVKKGDSPCAVIPFIVNAIFRNFLWKPDVNYSPDKTISQKSDQIQLKEANEKVIKAQNQSFMDKKAKEKAEQDTLRAEEQAKKAEQDKLYAEEQAKKAEQDKLYAEEQAKEAIQSKIYTETEAKKSEARSHMSNELKEYLDKKQGLVNVCVLCNTEQLICNIEILHIKSINNGGSNNCANLVRACKFCNRSFNQKTEKHGMNTRNLHPWLKDTYPKNYDNVINKFKEWGKDIVEYDGESE